MPKHFSQIIQLPLFLACSSPSKMEKVWKGHVGIVSEGNDAGKFRLIHARGEGRPSSENKTFETPEIYRSDLKFIGFFRPKNEIPEGKITPESGVSNTPVKSTTTTLKEEK